MPAAPPHSHAPSDPSLEEASEAVIREIEAIGGRRARCRPSSVARTASPTPTRRSCQGPSTRSAPRSTTECNGMLRLSVLAPPNRTLGVSRTLGADLGLTIPGLISRTSPS